VFLMYVHVWCFYVVIYYAEINLSIYLSTSTSTLSVPALFCVRMHTELYDVDQNDV